MKQQPDTAYYDLLLEIQQVEFVVIELNLYLNTHPDDQAAIAQYNDYTQRNMQLKKNFEAIYGPLANFGCSFSTTPWTWNSSPWPWQV
ncbi:spore coat protein CotJB [Aneurinibacillus tyrosinisolvens]|uniref:spore coat protein CotJB n=1 Tax=Aneurinibacillus tyrosinisolvens TaxID=1443435 RepID=UPI00063EDF20|nr:spore coat protein CotJB [Aneurinibacillus tyrosinisolvens]